MTVPKPEFGDSLASQNGPSSKVAEGARSSASKSLQHTLGKMKVCEDLPAAPAPKSGSSRGSRSRRGGGGEGGQGRGGSASRAPPGSSPVAAAAAAAAAMPPPGAFPQGFPYGSPYGQMFYYTMPVAPFGARQGMQQGSSSEAGAGGQQPLPPTMLPFPFPYGASALRPPARPPAGWGGIPLGMPRPALPPSSFHPAAPRTVPLPPRKSASETSAPPTPAHDRSARAALSSGGSSGSNSSCGDAAVDEQVAQPEGAQQQQQQEQEQQVGADAAPPPSANADSAGDGAAQQQAGDEAGGPASPAATEQRGGGSRGQGLDRQPCAFFLKTGTCAYGDRCKFEHPYDLAPHVEFNSLGLPLRPSEPNCSYYMKYKTCGFGHTCKFHHPELTEVGEGEQGAAPAVAGAHPAGPFAAMQYMQYGSGPFAMAFAYPGAPLQGQVPPGFMGPGSPGAPLFATPHGSQPPLPFVAPTPTAAKAAAALPKQLPGGASTPGGSPADQARLPAVAPVSPMPPVPMPLPVPMGSPAAASPLASGPASMSPPRPLMVFGRSKSAAEGSE